eukprot:TRINITY_DN27049_c0_g1_i1.p1 TRINITY_DN27049_c0_g1~~TRINITY_DN27049_c0_g1_i1.p1  ORF type:complete len:198 (-),score=36.94 TRINITY_DN27049_c0_g1_i1:15-608(-)
MAAASLSRRRADQTQPTPRGMSLPPAYKPGEFCGNQLGGMLQNLQDELRTLNREIRDEEEEKVEVGRQLRLLEDQQKRLQRALERATAEYSKIQGASEKTDKELGQHAETIHRLYHQVRSKHHDAIAILSNPETFNYHPAFNRPGDQFTGTYYSPPPLQMPTPKQSMAAQKLERLSRASNALDAQLSARSSQPAKQR